MATTGVMARAPSLPLRKATARARAQATAPDVRPARVRSSEVRGKRGSAVVSRVSYQSREASPDQGGKAFRSIPSFEECFPNSQKVVRTVEHDGEILQVRALDTHTRTSLDLSRRRELNIDRGRPLPRRPLPRREGSLSQDPLVRGRHETVLGRLRHDRPSEREPVGRSLPGSHGLDKKEGVEGRQVLHPDALRQEGHHYRGDGLLRCERVHGPRVRQKRGREGQSNHPEQQEAPRAGEFSPDPRSPPSPTLDTR